MLYVLWWGRFPAVYAGDFVVFVCGIHVGGPMLLCYVIMNILCYCNILYSMQLGLLSCQVKGQANDQ